MPDEDREPVPASDGMPTWVKVFAAVAVVAAAVVLIALVSGSGHGPGRHTQHGAGEVALPAASTLHG